MTDIAFMGRAPQVATYSTNLLFVDTVLYDGGESAVDWFGLHGGNVGMKFTVGPKDMKVTALGRFAWEGLGCTCHNVYLLTWPAGALIGTVLVPGTAAGATVWAWVDIAEVTLSANTDYMLISQEYVNTPDKWLLNPTYTATTGTAIATVTSVDSGPTTVSATSYLCANLKYYIP